MKRDIVVTTRIDGKRTKKIDKGGKMAWFVKASPMELLVIKTNLIQDGCSGESFKLRPGHVIASGLLKFKRSKPKEILGKRHNIIEMFSVQRIFFQLCFINNYLNWYLAHLSTSWTAVSIQNWCGHSWLKML